MKQDPNNNGLRSLFLPAALWLMLWASYNTIERILHPDFPGSSVDLFHGLRALLPFLAAYLATFLMLMRKSAPKWPFRGPWGLLVAYAFIAVISSILVSEDPPTAVYWAGQYGSVLIVLWVVLTRADAERSLAGLMTINWVMVFLLMAVPLLALRFAPGAVLSPGGFLHVTTGEGVEQVFGMPTTRSTGIGRYAAILGLVALARVKGSWRSKSFWLSTFFCSVYTLILMNARTAIFGFLAGAFVILWWRCRPRIVLLLGLGLVLLLLAPTGFYEEVRSFLTREKPFDPSLSGRLDTWQDTWNLFLDSPLIGNGFHADRIVLGQHVHNSVLHALVQAGILGALPFVVALMGSWLFLLRIYQVPREERVIAIPSEIPALLTFLTVDSVTESTYAFFGSVWLVYAPLFAYVQLAYFVTRIHLRKESLAAVAETP